MMTKLFFLIFLLSSILLVSCSSVPEKEDSLEIKEESVNDVVDGDPVDTNTNPSIEKIEEASTEDYNIDDIFSDGEEELDPPIIP